MKRFFFVALVTLLCCSARALQAQGQNQQLFMSQQFRMGERVIRIAEQGELADSINVWGDVGSPGRYLVPKGTSLSKLLSYSFGPTTFRDGQSELDWSRLRVEVNVQEYVVETNEEVITRFKYRFEDPLPPGMSTFKLKNNQTISVRVKRKATFRDYVQVIAPAISAIATTFVVVDRLSQ